jgi:hypothetical protein
VILEPGTFRVSDYRKRIPNGTKLAVMARDYDVDHDPALNKRPYDTDAGDFIPPQNHPDFLFLKRHDEHDEKTFGRKPGAERTVTTRGSDVGEGARTKDIQTSEAIHQAALASKDGDYKRSAEILASAPKQSRLKPKREWPSKSFPKGRSFPKRAKRNSTHKTAVA